PISTLLPYTTLFRSRHQQRRPLRLLWQTSEQTLYRSLSLHRSPERLSLLTILPYRFLFAFAVVLTREHAMNQAPTVAGMRSIWIDRKSTRLNSSHVS